MHVGPLHQTQFLFRMVLPYPFRMFLKQEQSYVMVETQGQFLVQSQVVELQLVY